MTNGGDPHDWVTAVLLLLVSEDLVMLKTANFDAALEARFLPRVEFNTFKADTVFGWMTAAISGGIVNDTHVELNRLTWRVDSCSI